MREADYLISGGEVVTPAGTAILDVAIEGERVVGLLEHPSRIPYQRKIDARGKFVLPGGVDPHVHFENPSMGTATAHDFYLGTVAAAAGGTTTVIDFAFQARGETALDSLRRRRFLADPQVVIDYGLHACITQQDRSVLEDIPLILDFGSPSFKVLLTYKNEGWMMEDGLLLDLMGAIADRRALLGVHAENDSIVQGGIASCVAKGDMLPGAHARSRPPISEVEAIRRCLFMARETECQLYVFHLTTEGGQKEVRDARLDGQSVMAETCPHYLVYTQDVLDGPWGYRYVMSPPLRSALDQQALWMGLADGSLEVVGSDDAAYFEEFKLRGSNDFRRIANGIPGAECRLAIVHSEGVVKRHLPLARMVEICATNPAKIFGLYPKKGIIAIGSDADIIVLDPNARWRPTPEEMHTNIEYTCYEDIEVQGRVVHVWSRGRHILDNGRLSCERGWGRFLLRLPQRQ